MVHINDCPEVEIFDGSQGHDDSTYLQRIWQHPEGFVANAYKPNAADVITLHRADCEEMRRPEGNYTEGPFFAAFSLSLQALEACAETWPGKVERCLKCNP